MLTKNYKNNNISIAINRQTRNNKNIIQSAISGSNLRRKESKPFDDILFYIFIKSYMKSLHNLIKLKRYLKKKNQT